jgi:hypothetical protein
VKYAKFQIEKNSGGADFVTTTRIMEKLALDLIEIREEGKYILTGIDYFTRFCRAEVIEEKKSEEVLKILRKWFGVRQPEQLITDNGKEFCSISFEKFCAERNILHRKIGVESHRSNGRVERVIRTIREGLYKVKEGSLEERLKRIICGYNDTYHSGIKCTPGEALSKKIDGAMVENMGVGTYSQRFKRRFREEFKEGEEVRIAKYENLQGQGKWTKGRFTQLGRVAAKCGKDSYLIYKEDGKITKKRHSEIKKIIKETTRLEGGC